MKISTSIRIVCYTDYSDCNIREALLYSLQNNEVLTLPMIWKIRVNKNRLLGSYWNEIRNLRKQGYQIETKMKLVDWVMCSTYRLINKEFSPSDSDNFNQI